MWVWAVLFNINIFYTRLKSLTLILSQLYGGIIWNYKYWHYDFSLWKEIFFLSYYTRLKKNPATLIQSYITEKNLKIPSIDEIILGVIWVKRILLKLKSNKLKLNSQVTYWSKHESYSRYTVIYYWNDNAFIDRLNTDYINNSSSIWTKFMRWSNWQISYFNLMFTFLWE